MNINERMTAKQFRRRQGKRPMGRKPNRGMNNWEKRYSDYLESLRMAGEVKWWGFECFRLRLAERTTYTPDFAVLWTDGTLEFHEIKGFRRDDAMVKFKVAAEQFNEFVFVMLEIGDKASSPSNTTWRVIESYVPASYVPAESH